LLASVLMVEEVPDVAVCFHSARPLA
jgi:hypothetical protein